MIFNNCSELVNGLVAMYNANISKATIEFQGDECEVLGGHPSNEDIKEGIFIINDRFPKHVFLVGVDNMGMMSLFLYSSPFRIDETLCVDIPSYVREELIDTLSGYWY